MIAESRNGRRTRTIEGSAATIAGVVSFVSRNPLRYGSIHHDTQFTWCTYIDELHNESVGLEVVEE